MNEEILMDDILSHANKYWRQQKVKDYINDEYGDMKVVIDDLLEHGTDSSLVEWSKESFNSFDNMSHDSNFDFEGFLEFALATQMDYEVKYYLGAIDYPIFFDEEINKFIKENKEEIENKFIEAGHEVFNERKEETRQALLCCYLIKFYKFYNH